MNARYLVNRTYRWLAITATFVHANAALYSPQPLPEGSISVQVPSAQYRPQGQTWWRSPQIPNEIAAADELLASRRLVVSGKPTYTSPTFVRSPQLEEADELVISRRAIFIPPETYTRSQITTVAPQREEAPTVPGLPEGSSVQQIPAALYRQQQITLTSRVPPEDVAVAEPDELLAARRIVYVPPASYAGKTFAGFLKLEESDELQASRRSVYLAKYPYQGKTLAVSPQIPDEVPIEADELHADHRSINLAKYPYRGFSFTRSPQTEQGQLVGLPEGSSTQVVPLAIYRANTNRFTTGVPVADVVLPESEETHHRTAIYIPVHRYIRPHIVTVSRLLYEWVPEADQCLVIVTEDSDNSNRTRIFTMQPPDPVFEFDERILGRIWIWQPDRRNFTFPNLTRIGPIPQIPGIPRTVSNLPLLGVG